MLIFAVNVHESPEFPRLIRNRGRGTRWWLSHGADTTFQRTYF